MGLRTGIDERQLAELSHYDTSEAFDELERNVLDYATGMTRDEVTDETVAALREQLSEKQVVELTAAIAWENYRARFNHALGIQSDGFAEGAACVLPQPVPQTG